MQVRPVGHYPEPGYPTRLEVLLRPELLRRNLPAAWRRIPGIATAVACFLSAELVACERSTSGSVASGIENKGSGTGSEAASQLVVAPLFKHGEGTASAGCVVVNPPSFLCEEEAVALIKQELAKHGVELGTPPEPWKTVRIAPRKWRYQRTPDKPNGMPVIDEEHAKPLMPDGHDRTRGIAFEYIDRSECNSLDGMNWGSTASSYNFISAAEHLRAQVAAGTRERTYFAVFYDPATERGLKCSRENLRQQVADFAEWLKGQGVL